MIRKILQITPAHGVRGVFTTAAGDSVGLPIVVWALVEYVREERTITHVIGMVIREGEDALSLVNEGDDGDLFIDYEYTP